MKTIKVLAVVLVLVILPLSMYGQTTENKTSWNEEGLKGYVKSMMEIHYQNCYQQHENVNITKDIEINDINCKKGKKVPFDASEFLFIEIAEGHSSLFFTKLVKKKITYYNEDGFLTKQKWEFFIPPFDLDNNLRYFIFTYKYNETGNRVECSFLDNTSTSQVTYTYHYDENNNVIFYQLKGHKQGIWKYKYDGNANIIEKSLYDGTGNILRGRWVYKYDTNSNIEEESKYDSKGQFTYKILYKYDNKRKREIYYDKDGGVGDKKTYLYDERGYLIRYIRESNYERSSKYPFNIFNICEYVYDSKGNWIKEVKYAGKEKILFEVIERTIEYYYE